MPRPHFPTEEGLKVQKENLSGWRKVLKFKAYKKLVEYVTVNNHTATSGYDVCRGDDIHEIIHNKIMREM